MNNNYFDILCCKYLSENISDSEKENFEKLLMKSEELRKRFYESKLVWESLNKQNPKQDLNLDFEWQRFTANYELHAPVKNYNRFIDRVTYYYSHKGRLIKPALILATLIILFFATPNILNDNSNEDNAVSSIHVINTQTKNVTLPDGSEVILNSGTTLEFPKLFNSKIREISLDGEAFFKVKKDTRPFIISTSNSKTTVLGTTFNVWARKNKTRVTVIEGKVNVGQTLSNESVILVQNQQTVIEKYSPPTMPQNVDALNLSSWVHGKLVFSSTPLHEVVDELYRHYGVKIRLEQEPLNSLILTGSFNQNKVSDVVEMICLTFNLNFKLNGDEFIISN